jgi:two-component system sensor histidine kinase KdpD
MFYPSDPRLRAVLAALAVVLATLALLPLRAHFNLATIALLLMIAVVSSSVWFGRTAALAAALLASVSLNFFFIPPYHTLSITHTENIIAFVAFLVMGVLAGHLSATAREEARRADQQRTHAEVLYEELQRAVEVRREQEAQIQTEKIKTAFLDAVTHDLRTPLTSIKAAATTLQPQISADNERVRELLMVIVEESDRLNRFIEGILELARLEGGHASLRMTRVSVNELVDAALERAGGRLRDHRVEVLTRDDLPPVTVDRTGITEVLYTLLDNAAKYSRAYSRVAVCATVVGNEVHVTVEDEGKGIPSALRSRVFERFVRAEGGMSGFGMGLAIAKAIIDAHHGRIWIDGRRSGQGTAITFTLPLSEAVHEVHA